MELCSRDAESSGGCGLLVTLAFFSVDVLDDELVFDGDDRDLESLLVLVLELHDAIDERVDGVVGADADVASRVPLGAALANDDVARGNELAAVLLDAAVLRIAYPVRCAKSRRLSYEPCLSPRHVTHDAGAATVIRGRCP